MPDLQADHGPAHTVSSSALWKSSCPKSLGKSAAPLRVRHCALTQSMDPFSSNKGHHMTKLSKCCHFTGCTGYFCSQKDNWILEKSMVVGAIFSSLKRQESVCGEPISPSGAWAKKSCPGEGEALPYTLLGGVVGGLHPAAQRLQLPWLFTQACSPWEVCCSRDFWKH